MSPGCSTVAVKGPGHRAGVLLPCRVSLIDKGIVEWTRGDLNP